MTLARFATLATFVALAIFSTLDFRAAARSSQSEAAKAPQFGEGSAFEVASVKQNKSGAQPVQIGIRPGGQYVAINVPLRMLIRSAYQLQDFQLIGGPDWMGTDRFDINAKAEGDVPPSAPGTAGPIQYMVRTLLADRFKLVAHKETRDMPIYSLVVARSDGRLGDKIKPSTSDCAAMFAAARAGGAPPPLPKPGDPMMCGMRIGLGLMNGGSFPLSQLATSLSPFVNRIVVDKTGLTGNFDFTLEFRPDQAGLPGLPAPIPGGVITGGRGGDAPDPAVLNERPSIFTALQEQLGLKLESGRGPVEVLVIDSVERPTED